LGVLVAVGAIFWTSKLARKQIKDEHVLAEKQKANERALAEEQKEHERKLAERQKDLETLLQLSHHLTAWHDDLLRVLDEAYIGNPEELDKFMPRMKYQGPLNIFLALLGETESQRFRRTKYTEVINNVRGFERTALEEKAWAHFHRDPHLRTNWRKHLTESYNKAMEAISDQAKKL
jgi:hypothetical protein